MLATTKVHARVAQIEKALLNTSFKDTGGTYSNVGKYCQCASPAYKSTLAHNGDPRVEESSKKGHFDFQRF